MVPVSLMIIIPLLLALIISEIIADRIYNNKLFGLHDTMTNLSLAVGNHALNIFLNVMAMGGYIYLYDNLAIFHQEPTFLSALFCLIVFDFCFYWEHRLSHEVNFLWGTHVVHHSSEEYNLTVALRRSWFVNLVVMFFFLPIPVLGFDLKVFLVVMAFHNVVGYIQHTKLVKKLPSFVEYIFNTPSHHRVHHGVNPKYIDKNYAGMFILWDRLFGTFQVEEEEPTYGITTRLKSWDPLKAHTHYFEFLFEKARQARNWKDRIKLFFARPGWLPDYLGGFQAPPPVSEDCKLKYDIPVPRSLNYYVIFQFILAACGVLIVTFYNIFNFTIFFQIAFFLLIAMASLFPTGLLDRKKWIGQAEFFRLSSTYLILNLYVFYHQYDLFLYFFILITIVFAVITSWFNDVWKGRFDEPETNELKEEIQLVGDKH